MYPFIRMAKERVVNRSKQSISVGEIHESYHICWPWDLDFWFELNNGRALTLYDLGRIPFSGKSGFSKVIFKNKWSMTMAGANVRYRKRLRAFERIRRQTRTVCWDERFLYIEQSMWNTKKECAGHIVYRAAFVGADGIINPQRIFDEIEKNLLSPKMPDWLSVWVNSENKRPWPPMQEYLALIFWNLFYYP